MLLIYGNSVKRDRRDIDPNQTPYAIMANSSFKFDVSAMELNGLRLTEQEVREKTLIDLNAQDGSILMYNEKFTGA